MKATPIPIKPLARAKGRIQQRLTLALGVISTLFIALPALGQATTPAANPETGTTVSENISKLILTNACMGCELAGADLSAAHLIGADLRAANLTGADLSHTNLEGADLTSANLTNANLTEAFLTNAVMNNARLDQVNFTGAHLYYAQVGNASVQNINLTNAQVLHTPLSIGGSAPGETDSPKINKLLPQRPIIDPATFEQNNAIFPSDLYLLDRDDLINLPAPIVPARL